MATTTMIANVRMFADAERSITPQHRNPALNIRNAAASTAHFAVTSISTMGRSVVTIARPGYAGSRRLATCSAAPQWRRTRPSGRCPIRRRISA